MSLALDLEGAAKTGSRRSFIAGAGLTLVAAAAAALTPRRSRYDFSQDNLAHDIPLQFKSWSASGDADEVVPDPLANDSPFEHTLTRTYDKPGAPQVMLLITYHGPASQDLKVHRPEICYKVAGFDLHNVSSDPIRRSSGRRINVETFTARRGSRIEQVFYWTRVGDRFPSSMMDQRITSFKDGLEQEISDGLLFRLSLIGEDRLTAHTTLRAFCDDLLNSLSPRGLRLLLGSESAA